MDTDKQKVQPFVLGNGNKRSRIERRRFSYDAHIPERRSGKDRRSSQTGCMEIDRHPASLFFDIL